MTPKEIFDPRDALLAAATEIIRRPSAELGWTGDTDLFVCYERLEDRWSVWREDGDGMFRPVMKQKDPGQKLDPSVIIRSLVERDTYLRNNSHERHMEKIIQANERVSAERDAAAAEMLSETMQKVYHAVATNNTAETGYVRPLAVGAAFKDAFNAKVHPIAD